MDERENDSISSFLPSTSQNSCEKPTLLFSWEIDIFKNLWYILFKNFEFYNMKNSEQRQRNGNNPSQYMSENCSLAFEFKVSLKATGII